MKPHEFSALVNELRDVSVKFGHTQQMRAHIAKTLRAHGIEDGQVVKMSYPAEVNVSLKEIDLKPEDVWYPPAGYDKGLL